MGMGEYIGHFDRDLYRSVASSAPALSRESFYKQYDALPLPKATDESWRRTPPALFLDHLPNRMAELTRLEGCDVRPEYEEYEVVIQLSDKGFCILDNAGLLERERIFIHPLADVPAVASSLTPCIPLKEKHEALNGAFWNAGWYIHVPRRVHLDTALLIDYIPGDYSGAVLPRIVLQADSESRLVFVDNLAMEHENGWMVSGVDVRVEEGADVSAVSMNSAGPDFRSMAYRRATVARDARMNWMFCNFGGRAVKQECSAELNGPGAQARFRGLYCASENQHVDQGTMQWHAVPDAGSDLLYKGSVQDKAYSLYRGMIHVQEKARGTDAYQKNNNLVLNKGARADSIPGLEIHADDLSCSHGSTTCSLNPEEVFYLQTRGLPEPVARKLIIQGFFEDVLRELPGGAIRAAALKQLEDKLKWLE